MGIPGDAYQIKTFQVTYTHRAIIQNFECVHGFEKPWAHARKPRKNAFCILSRVFGFVNAERKSDTIWIQHFSNCLQT